MAEWVASERRRVKQLQRKCPVPSPSCLCGALSRRIHCIRLAVWVSKSDIYSYLFLVRNPLSTLPFPVLTLLREVGIIIPILWNERQKLREVKQLARSHS